MYLTDEEIAFLWACTEDLETRPTASMLQGLKDKEVLINFGEEIRFSIQGEMVIEALELFRRTMEPFRGPEKITRPEATEFFLSRYPNLEQYRSILLVGPDFSVNAVKWKQRWGR